MQDDLPERQGVQVPSAVRIVGPWAMTVEAKQVCAEVSEGLYEKPMTPQTRVVHCKDEKDGVYIGRPSDWGNPFEIGRDGTRKEVIEKYRQYLLGRPDLLARIRPELRGRVLRCWCDPRPCHGHILAQIADAD